jgi:hypothetical protein
MDGVGHDHDCGYETERTSQSQSVHLIPNLSSAMHRLNGYFRNKATCGSLHDGVASLYSIDNSSAQIPGGLKTVFSGML